MSETMLPTSRPRQTTWHRRFLDLALMVAGWSKDPECKVGAVLVNDRRIVATGYNGFPSGITDSYCGIDGDEKNAKTIHAELNALLNAGDRWASTLYCTKDPCLECSKAIIQAQVREIVLPPAYNATSKWEKSQSAGNLLMCEAGIKIVRLG